MDLNASEAKMEQIISNLKPQKEALVSKEEDSETQSLLLPENGGIFKGPSKIKRNVQWNDTNGNKLAEVLEFQPSDVSDSEDDDSDSCFCTIM